MPSNLTWSVRASLPSEAPRVGGVGPRGHHCDDRGDDGLAPRLLPKGLLPKGLLSKGLLSEGLPKGLPKGPEAAASPRPEPASGLAPARSRRMKASVRARSTSAAEGA